MNWSVIHFRSLLFTKLFLHTICGVASFLMQTSSLLRNHIACAPAPSIRLLLPLLQPQDLIHQITLSLPIRSRDDFQYAISKVEAGDRVHFVLLHDNGDKEVGHALFVLSDDQLTRTFHSAKTICAVYRKLCVCVCVCVCEKWQQ